MALLKEAERRIEYQKDRNNHCLNVLMEAELDHDDEFKHPRNWGPELPQRTSERMDRGVGYGVQAELLETAASLVAGQPGYFSQRGGYGFHLGVTALLVECAIIA